MISVILGLQFGDEGKGKITDFISKDYDDVVRFNGGSNAGHTVLSIIHIFHDRSAKAAETFYHFAPFFRIFIDAAFQKLS